MTDDPEDILIQTVADVLKVHRRETGFRNRHRTEHERTGLQDRAGLVAARARDRYRAKPNELQFRDGRHVENVARRTGVEYEPSDLLAVDPGPDQNMARHGRLTNRLGDTAGSKWVSSGREAGVS